MKHAISGILAILVAATTVYSASADDGRKKLGTISSKEYVVTQEQDPLFNVWVRTNQFTTVETDPLFTEARDSEFNVFMGKNAYAGPYSVAIGNPLNITNNYLGGNASTIVNPNGWSGEYLGPAEAYDRSVAIGDAAKAAVMVGVAIGNQAHVSPLHGTNGIPYTYTTRWIEVVRKYSTGNGELVSATTNELQSTSYTVDMGMYERCPTPNENWVQRISTTSTEGSYRVNRTTYEQGTTYIVDNAYVDEDEMPLWDRIVSTGQGLINLKNATYGVAVGSRAYVYGQQSVALGHYSHATRPCSLAIGSESWTASEGTTTLGWNADILGNSPLSMALGMYSYVPGGMTNAIVIGSAEFNPSATNMSNMCRFNSSSHRPTAMKSNSINIVYHGNGLQDFFVDNVSVVDRLASESRVIGSSSRGETANDVDATIQELTGIDGSDNHMVLYSENGIHIFTDNYERGLSSPGDISNVFINGKPLAQIIQSNASAAMSRVSGAAATAQEEVNSANDMAEVKQALNKFFNSIK